MPDDQNQCLQWWTRHCLCQDPYKTLVTCLMNHRAHLQVCQHLRIHQEPSCTWKWSLLSYYQSQNTLIISHKCLFLYLNECQEPANQGFITACCRRISVLTYVDIFWELPWNLLFKEHYTCIVNSLPVLQSYTGTHKTNIGNATSNLGCCSGLTLLGTPPVNKQDWGTHGQKSDTVPPSPSPGADMLPCVMWNMLSAPERLLLQQSCSIWSSYHTMQHRFAISLLWFCTYLCCVAHLSLCCMGVKLQICVVWVW